MVDVDEGITKKNKEELKKHLKTLKSKKIDLSEKKNIKNAVNARMNIAPDQKENGALLKFFELNWTQIRHVESVIMWYTEIYMGIIAGIIALTGEINFEDKSSLILFLLIITILGLSITVRIKSQIDNRQKKGLEIMIKLKIIGYKVYKKDSENIIKEPKKLFHWMNLITIFYIIMLIVWMYLLLFNYLF